MKTIFCIFLSLGLTLPGNAQVLPKNPSGEFMSTIVKSNLVVTHLFLKTGNIPGVGKDETIFQPRELRIFSLSAVDVIQVEFQFRDPGKITLQILDDNNISISQREIPYSGIFKLEEIDMSAYPAGFYKVSISFIESNDVSGRTGNYTIHKIH
jgi:hypothetical protein